MGDGRRRARMLWIGAALAGVLWVVSGALNALLGWYSVPGGGRAGVLPETVPSAVWARPGVWAVASVLVGVIAIALVHRAVTSVLAADSRRRTAVLITWFAAVLAGGLVGVAADIAGIIVAFPPQRLAWLLDGLGTSAAVGAYWGLVQGWIPALVVAFGLRRARATGVAESSAGGGMSRSRWIAVGGVAVALIALVPIGVGGQRAAVTVAAQQEAIDSGFSEDDGALPDPFAGSTPVPTVAADGVAPEADWCTPEQAMVLYGDHDAATGHRVTSIRLMNFSEGTCVVNGYPDIAFADQNGNLLDVQVDRGSSFMATDPGAQRVEVPAGGTAIAYIGWNANPTVDELVATELFAAMFPGETRGSWPVEMDVIEGSSVTLTAWALEVPQGQP
ncbi:DUF4232 domain-containing protein [Plantibacter flavus]|uniref:DUF4232 domain-containing protein n=1 Tax=Plantibacter flavus TaxID=150123 RepID=UPI003F18A09A